MADSQRATSVIAWRLGFTAGLPHSTPCTSDCQVGRKSASAGGASPKFRIYVAPRLLLFFSAAVFPLGVLTVASVRNARPLLPFIGSFAGTIDVPTSAIVVVGIVFVVLVAMICARSRTNARLAEEHDGLRTVLHKAEQHARESEAALRKHIDQLKRQIASLLAVPTQEPLREVGAKVRIAVPPDGSEVLLPLLDPCRVYQITIHGTCTFSERTGWFSRDEAHADALYRTDELGNFLKIHNFVKLKDTPIRRFLTGVPPEAMANQDRKAHVYRFRIDGSSKKISTRFCITSDGLSSVSNRPLTLTVELLPVGTPSPAAAARREEAAREMAKEVEQEVRESAKRLAALETRLRSLRLRAHREKHFLDLQFQQDFARHDGKTILKTLNSKWHSLYDQFMQDAPLKTLAETKAPEVIQWLEARVNIVQLAERFAVAPPPESIEEQKPTVEDARALVLSQHANRFDEEIALMELKGQKLAKLNEATNALPIDEDEKQRLSQQVSDSIFEEGEEHDHGKNGHTL